MKQNTIWIAGASGNLGTALMDLLKANFDNKVIGTDKDLDVTDSKAVFQAAEMYRPNIIVNLASISDVEYCENNPVEAYKVNALGARNLASAARLVNARIIQLSTDDIFIGNEGDVFNEFDTPTPSTVYGKSKLAGENFVRELNPKHLIIRSSWLYGVGDSDYFSYVLKMGQEGKSFQAPKDQISTPTYVKELARFLKACIGAGEYGIFHASCEGNCSRAEFAKSILTAMNYSADLVQEVESAEGKKNSTQLDNMMLKMTEIYTMANWQDSLNEYIKVLKEEQ